ncbi:hypothetical protein EJB05_05459, partial [Eragrostis curvula]
MDSEVQPLDPSSSSPPRAAVRSRPGSWSSSGSSGGVEYTSLRDVLAESGPGSGSGGGGGSFGDYDGGYVIDLDASNINIRNQLLKHAASAYLQSAIVDVAPRERGCLSRTWRRLLQRRRCRILLRPCGCEWPAAGCCGGAGDGDGDPASRCAECVAGSLRRLAAFFSGCFACMWT